MVVNGQGLGSGHPLSSSPASASTNSTDGLRLVLSINATSLTQGQRLLITATELNTLSAPNNVSKAQSWGVDGLRIGACYSSIYPFGVAVYQGRYTQANVSEAKPVQIFPLVPCPMLIRLVTGYLFQANSDMAQVLPGTGAALPMEANVTVSGNYSPGFAYPSTAPAPLLPGTYTVAAGDEWGALAFLYFQVVESPA